MPYVKDERFEEPPPDVSLWRYMSLDRFVSLLATGKLWFAPQGRLGDPFEGLAPVEAAAAMEARIEQLAENMGPEWKRRAYLGDKNVRKYVLRTTAVNCWRVAPIESAVMWSAYAPNGGVVVRSSFPRFVAALKSAPQTIHVGRVQYVDHSTYNGLQPNDYLAPTYLKRPQYAEEQEVRAAIDRGYLFMGPPEDPYVTHNPGRVGGEPIAVDLDALVHDVRVGPGSPAWAKKAVTCLVRRYSHCFPVLSSEVDARRPRRRRRNRPTAAQV